MKNQFTCTVCGSTVEFEGQSGGCPVCGGNPDNLPEKGKDLAGEGQKGNEE